MPFKNTIKCYIKSTILTHEMPLATRLQPATIDAKVCVTHQASLAQKPGVGVQYLHHVGVISTKPELLRTVLVD